MIYPIYVCFQQHRNIDARIRNPRYKLCYNVIGLAFIPRGKGKRRAEPRAEEEYLGAVVWRHVYTPNHTVVSNPPVFCRPRHDPPDATDRHRLLGASSDEDRATARRVAELTTKHEEAKFVLATLIATVAVIPQSGRNGDSGRALVAIREGVEGVHNHISAVAATSGEASRRFARGAGGAGAAVEPMDISSAATSSMEEGRSS